MERRATPAEMLIRQQLLALKRALPAAQKGDVARLHEARVATRRLRERIPLLLPNSTGRKIVRKVRRLSRALGPVRELDVAIQTLEALGDSDVPPAAVTKLRQLMRQERQRLHADMCSEVAHIDVDKLRRRAVAVAEKEDSSPTPVRAVTRVKAAQERAARRAMRLRAAVDDAAGLYLPDRLHDVRIAVKKLRYSLELVREIKGSRALARIAMLKEAQDLLGRMHDLEVLIGRVRAVQGSSSAANLRLSAGLDRLVRRLETECRQLHGHYMTVRQRLMAVCEHTVTTAESSRAKSDSSAA